ncbi:DHH family phosphoesterase [Vaginella massiliensis]|uniref:DHH family phosphoesterase n=1 Tax=Vaginella massiliensis TaxID=1816680 RepID=UPI000A9DC658|nr:bifunctional oligoribonuclease/PAP phosphatase NrnA [Vaginella massiliensis]
MQMTNFEGLKNLLASPKKIAILPHKNPDGDAIGATLAMSLYLKKLNHSCNVVAPNEFPKFLKWLPEAKNIVIADYQPKRAEAIIHQADLIFILDFNTLSRIDDLGNWVKASHAPKVLIDHHQAPDLFDFMYSDTSMPATCQMVYNFIEAMGDLSKIDKDIASCIYTGIMTDTGGFRFRNTSSSTHRIVANLIDAGVEVDKVSSYVNDSSSPSRLKLLAVTLDQLTFLPDYRTAFMYLTREQMKENGFQKGDTEGFVNYGLSIDNYVFSVIFIEDTHHNFIKISLRSKGNFDVNEFARKHFNGGGHMNAAGGRSDLPIEETLHYFESLLPLYQEQLKNIEL